MTPLNINDFLLYPTIRFSFSFSCYKIELLGLLHCNEVDQHRHDWLLKTLESYVPPTLRHLLSVTHLDGRSIGSMRPGAYDKVPHSTSAHLSEPSKLQPLSHHLAILSADIYTEWIIKWILHRRTLPNIVRFR